MHRELPRGKALPKPEEVLRIVWSCLDHYSVRSASAARVRRAIAAGSTTEPTGCLPRSTREANTPLLAADTYVTGTLLPHDRQRPPPKVGHSALADLPGRAAETRVATSPRRSSPATP